MENGDKSSFFLSNLFLNFCILKVLIFELFFGIFLYILCLNFQSILYTTNILGKYSMGILL